MSIFFEILIRIASYGPQIDQLHGENRLIQIYRYTNKYMQGGQVNTTPQLLKLNWAAFLLRHNHEFS